MTTENISLFQAMNAKMQYLTQRQKVISQNVANADTPNYNAQDLGKPDFSKMLKNISHSTTKISLETTTAGHLAAVNEAVPAKMRDNKTPYEVNPSGNGVDLEEQMMKSNDVQLNYSLMVNLYRSNMDMIRVAIGKNK